MSIFDILIYMYNRYLEYGSSSSCGQIEKCKLLISSFLRRKKVTLQEIQSLTGVLNFACSVVVPGRVFLRGLIDLTKGVKSAHFVRLTKWVKADFSMWQSFLDDFNGRSFFLSDIWPDSFSLNLYTDAAASLGYGAVFGNSVHGQTTGNN